MLRRYIGSRDFYRVVMAVAVPIMIQNFITNFVGMLDNIMVGRIGTAEMSGVSIVNQIIFVLYLCAFGATSGAGIFTAQFNGSGDHEGVRYTFRFKLIISLALTAVGVAVMLAFGGELIRLFLRGEGEAGEAERYLGFGVQYLGVMLWGLLPFAISNVYSSTMRECGETLVPMASGIAAVLVNLFFNWVLIFGRLGAPALGVVGAAVATVISRFVELGINAIWVHRHPERMPFISGAYRSMKIPGGLAWRIAKKCLPLFFNEGLWSGGMTVLAWCYSLKGLGVVGAVNICNTLTNTMSVALIAMGNAVGIIIGNKLGAGDPEEDVLDATRKLAAFSVFFTALFALAQIALSGVFPLAYNTTDEIRATATGLIIISALYMPARAFANVSYFTLRSGGKTLITFLFDSCFVWTVTVPVAFVLARFTPLPILPLFAAAEASELVKCVLGYLMLRSRKWMNRLV